MKTRFHLIKNLLALILLTALGNPIFSQVILNEISSVGGVEDTEGEDQDWIELYNAGPTTINLAGYALSDDEENLEKFIFQGTQMAPGEHLLVLASGQENNQNALDLYVHASDEWSYLYTSTEFPVGWANPTFDDSDWFDGPGGIGFGDGDDGTNVPNGTLAVLLRKGFTIEDINDLENLYLFMDYDDGFIAYLNGVEFARSENLSGQGSGITVEPSVDHEAGLYAGFEPEVYQVPEDFLQQYVQTGINTLAIEVHNIGVFSSDLSSNAFLIGEVNGTPTTSVSGIWWLEDESQLATNFNLNMEGESLFFSDPQGTLVEQVAIPTLQYEHSYSKQNDGTEMWCISDQPSPEEANPIQAICGSEFIAPPTIVTEPGFYANQVSVEISHSDPSAIIRYTLTGDIPTEGDPAYSSPLQINSTTVVAARAFGSGYVPSRVTKSTYFIDDDNQGISTISISTNFENLWDNETGIYVLGDDYNPFYPFFGANFWEPWERVSYFEYFDVDKIHAFELEMALEIHGGWSRAEDQKSFRIDTKQNLGGHIDYPLIPAKGFITEWNNFNLRNGGQTYGNNRMQDAFIGRLVRDTEIDANAYAPVQVFLNGEYWGLYGIREKMDEAYVAVNHGYDPDEVNLIGPFQTLSGSPDNYQSIVNYAVTTAPNNSDFLDVISSEVDLFNMTDYFATEVHVQNLDWNGIAWGENNVKVWRSNEAGSKWRFMMYDLDGALGNFGTTVNENYLELAINPSQPTNHSALFGALLQNESFRHYFINRYADLINTIFQPYQYESVAAEISGSIAEAMPRHIDRWGAPQSVPFWAFSVNNMQGYLEDRIPFARQHIRNQFGLPGQIEVTLQVQPPGAGQIKISTIYPDSNPWSGIYFEEVPVQITAIPNPGFSFENWDPNDHFSALTTAGQLLDLEQNDVFVANFAGQAVTPDIIISEINYHSNDDFDAGDWIELYNRTNVPIALADWVFQDEQEYNTFTIPIDATIPAQGIVILSNDMEKFQTIHPNTANVYGNFNFGLSNGGDLLRLFDQNETELFNVIYDDEDPWPLEADGEGYTLELLDPAASDFGPTAWVSECFLGTPGVLYTGDCEIISSTEEPNLTSEHVKVFPNPASDYILLELTDPSHSNEINLLFFNATGQKLKEATFTPDQFLHLNIADLPAGMYYLHWQHGDVRGVEKVVVE